ncbi:MAG: peptidylprolyl isomerase [Alphaproteobacteria bacterium]
MNSSRIGLAALATCLLFATTVRAAETEAPPAKAKEAAPAQAAPGKNPVVQVKTSLGSFDVELYPDKAPATVKNFLAYVDSGFYDGTVFHRVIRDFMIQGGGMTKDLQQKPTNPPVKNEADNGLKNTLGTVAMARTSAVDSATSQFFVNTKDNAFLDHRGKTPTGWGYTVFGKVVSGLDVVRKIEAVETGSGKGGLQDVPKTPVVIESVKLQK